MTNKHVDFANLTQEQLGALQLFEKDFNTKYNTHLFLMAMDTK